MGLKVTNNAFGTLNAGINSSATTIVLVAGQGARFPTLSAGDYFYATLIDTSNNLEIVKVTARSTDTMTVVRGQDNTTARAYSTNDRFELRPTAALFNEKANDADVAATYLSKTGGTATGRYNFDSSTWSNTTGGDVHIRNSSTTGAALTIEPTASSSFAAGWSLYAGAASASVGDGGFGFWNHTTQQAPFFVDQSGRVRMPYQPAFQAQAVESDTNYGNVVLPYPGVILNQGGHYNNSTYRFTAPVAGVYCFSWDVWHSSSSNSGTGRAFIRKNGAYYKTSSYGSNAGLHARLGDTAADDDSSKTVLIALAVNDYVDIYNGADNITLFFSSGFSGFLVG
jgi:hypothetical protein